jgi:uncharacterized protein YggE
MVMTHSKPARVAFLILLAGGLLAACNDIPKQRLAGRLTVRGEAAISAAPDQMRLNVGVITSAPTVEAAMKENNIRLKQVEIAFEKIGLTKAEYPTGLFQIQPQWMPRPRQADADWTPHISAYRAVNNLRVKTGKLNLAGKIIAAAAQAGANQIGALVFDLADPRQYRAQAIAAATDRAKVDARSLAEAGGVSLEKILSLKLENATETPLRLKSTGINQAMMASRESAPAIIPGDVMVRAGVLIVYQVESSNQW